MKALKFLMIPFAALAMACGGSEESNEPVGPGDEPNNGNIPQGELVLSVAPGLIVADGVDKAVFTATLDGNAVTGFTVYDSMDTPISGTEFTTTKAGTYTFWASYGVNISKKVTLEATEQEVPDLPADSNPAATNFVHRALYTVYTGSGCMYCPYMTAAVHTVQEDAVYGDKFVMTACHAFTPTSPAYCDAAEKIGNELNPTGNAPVGFMDFAITIENSGVAANVNNIKSSIDNRTGSAATAGIAASASLSGNRIIVRTAVKAAVTGQYRVNVWLVEDGIYAKQSGDTSLLEGYDFNTHNNVIRLSGSERVVKGNSLGEIVAGNIAEQVFVMTLDSEWKKENMRAVVYVNSVDGNNVSIANVISLGTNDQKAFEYAE